MVQQEYVSWQNFCQMTIIVKEGMEDWNHAINKGSGKKWILKEKPNSIDSLVQCVKSVAA